MASTTKPSGTKKTFAGKPQPKFEKYAKNAPPITDTKNSANPYEQRRMSPSTTNSPTPKPFLANPIKPETTRTSTQSAKPFRVEEPARKVNEHRTEDKFAAPRSSSSSLNATSRNQPKPYFHKEDSSGNIIPHKVFGFYEAGRSLYTKSIFPGFAPFEERLIQQGNDEYREIDPRRSKLGAAVAKGATNVGIRQGDIVLYLGISHGYTSSFVSDMVGKEGVVFGVDPAPRVIRDATFLSQKRTNIIPLLASANQPEEYIGRVCMADIVYQDIAQRNQADIFIRNCDLFLKKGGYGLLAVKARSIDIKKKPKDIFNETRLELEKHFTVIDFRLLDPFEKDHCMIIVKK